MRRTIYRGIDQKNADLTSNEFDRKSVWVAPMLIEYEFYDHKTGEKVNSKIVEVSATYSASLKLSLKSAIELLQQRGLESLSFEFDGMKFRVTKDDKLEDLFDMIIEVIDARNQAYAKMAELKNGNNAGV